MSSEDRDLVGHEEVGYDPATGTYRVRHDGPPFHSLSYSLLRGVSAVTGVEPQNLDPLTETVDPDALDALFEPAGGAPPDVCLTVRFHGCDVAIYSDGHLVIRPPAE